ncbi:MAG: FAD:protein FMN transferase [Alphaproteobacteria bacterium]|nr:FAD:protein FMN transferase [Alphaproteobacteria bacterium]
MRPRGLETTPELLKRLALPAVFVTLLFGALWARSPEPAPLAPAAEEQQAVELRGEAWGTTYSVKVIGRTADPEQLAATVEETLARVDSLMSNWRKDSEISRFNAGGTEPFPLSPETAEVMALALAVHARTGGAFDVTVGPLVERWGFGPEGREPEPDAAELERLLASVGSDKLTLGEGTLSKSSAEVRVDLAAIAKGYGVERLAQALAALPGVDAVMVEIGGEVRVIGDKPGGEPWRLAIERPDEGRREVHSVVQLRDNALATSGDYRRFIDEHGQRRTHVVDPRTGRPVEHGVASASVLAADCGTADAWATSLMVLGPDEGLALVERTEGLETMLIVREGEGFEVRMSEGFRAALAAPPEVLE